MVRTMLIGGAFALALASPAEARKVPPPPPGLRPEVTARVMKTRAHAVTRCVKASAARHDPGVTAATLGIVLTIAPSGQLTQVELTRSSGSAVLDRCLVRAFGGLRFPHDPAPTVTKLWVRLDGA